MSSEFSLSDYVSNGIENIVKGIIKASLKNPKETAFVVKYALASKEAKKDKGSFYRKRRECSSFLNFKYIK